MKKATKEKLELLWQECLDEDKSTEYFIQLAQDTLNVSFDCVINFLQME